MTSTNTKKLTERIPTSILVAIIFVAGFVIGSQYTVIMAAQSGPALPADVEPDFAAFYQAYNLIEDQYLDVPEVEVLVDGAIRGMVKALDDPYSNYVDPELFSLESDDYDGEIQGIGVVISVDEVTEEIIVVNVMADTPAERAGIQEGDAFAIVDEENVLGLTYLELALRVRGPAGSTVDITMRRGDEMIDFTIERARIPIPNVEWELLDGDIGYIYMAQFTRVSRPQVDDALTQLKDSDLNGLIFDLRGNPGGLLSSATEIAGLFLEQGVILIEDFGDGEKTIFKVQDDLVLQIEEDSERIYTRNSAYSDLDIPIIVLLDDRSASASEVVAGAWQDHGVVTIIGQTSFGKGTVQIQNTLINGGGARLTVARWLTPEGNWISGQGVTPDIMVEIPEGITFDEEDDPYMAAAIDFINSENAEAE
jgi:carboxyl-terminal processing protease